MIPCYKSIFAFKPREIIHFKYAIVKFFSQTRIFIACNEKRPKHRPKVTHSYVSRAKRDRLRSIHGTRNCMDPRYARMTEPKESLQTFWFGGFLEAILLDWRLNQFTASR